MNNKGISAVIGVILMVTITIAIAVVVYVYVEQLLDNDNDKIVEVTGILQEVSKDKVVIGNNTIKVTSHPVSLTGLLGQNVTVMFEKSNNEYTFRGVKIEP